MHGLLLHNGEIRASAEKLLSPGQVGLLNGWGVFSTLRVFDGVLFAFERHWARMMRDAALFHVPLPGDAEVVRGQLLKLVEANEAFNATMRVLFVRNRGGMWEGPGLERDWDLIAFTAPVHHWGGSVRLAVQPQARYSASPFAGAKILSWSANLAWLEAAQGKGFDEVILLNERGQVSECTSANIFVASGNRVRTPPLSSGCLPGVTREVLLNEMPIPGLTIEEAELTIQDLEAAEEVFITSTTRDLLPVRDVGGVALCQSGSARERLQRGFSAYVDRYVMEAQRFGHAAAGRRTPPRDPVPAAP